MRPEMTAAVALALQAAERQALREGTSAVQPRHVLFGLLNEEEGRVAVLLARAGLDLAELRGGIADSAMQEFPEASGLSLLHADQVRQALDKARAWSNDNIVASEALLLSLLQEEPSLRSLLESLGLAFERLEAEVMSLQAPPLRLEEPLHLADETERIDLARIVDAGANRAREALRVVEDYCRFVLDDAYLSGELKRLRHELADIFAEFPVQHLLQARETLHDVGTDLTTERESYRESPAHVVQTNLKRLQEALRSLEEFGKVLSPKLGEKLERLRYRTYTLERALVLGGGAREQLAYARLCVLVTGSQCQAALDWTIHEAAAGGANLIQLREKELEDRALLERARQVRRWTQRAGALFIVNDRPDIARLAEADGVHLGQEDMTVKDARRTLGPDALIGVSTHNLDQVRQAVLDGASYIGLGPAFPSSTKEFADVPGLEFVRQATAETSLPAFVIGGVNLNTIEAAVAAGARRVAVSQAICQADDPRGVALGLVRALEAHAL